MFDNLLTFDRPCYAAPVMASWLERFLDISGPPAQADCILVFAGAEDRKRYGIELWRRGVAPELILSVGRFEWRRYYDLGLPGDGGLRRLVDSIPPQERHFFVRLRHSEAEALPVIKGRFGTATEARALAALFQDQPPATIMVVSNSIHLRRIALSLRRAFSRHPAIFRFTAVPSQFSTPLERWLELKKYLFYLLFLRL